MITTICIVISGLLIYIFILRPAHLRWGATKEEVRMLMPGDDIVQKTDFIATRAISIHASQAEIWKWIIQIGSGRAGWYSIDWIDNGGKPSSASLIQEYQEIYAGQFIPFTPDQKNGMWVKEFIENDYILWTDKKDKATWTWKLVPDGIESTRLLTRLRTRYDWKSLWILYYLIYDFGDIIMMKKCLKGIKIRAEKIRQPGR
mgnify:CR=1 FL=1